MASTKSELTKTQEMPAFSSVVVFEDVYLADHADIEASKPCGVRRPGSERVTAVMPAILD